MKRLTFVKPITLLLGHIHPVQEAWKSHDSLYMGQVKSCQMLSKTTPKDYSCQNDSKIVVLCLTYLRSAVSNLFKKRY